VELAREAACLASALHAFLHLGLLEHAGHILGRQWPPLRLPDSESGAILTCHRILPVLAMLVKAGAEPVSLCTVLCLDCRRR
jgi:hypothetical protein